MSYGTTQRNPVSNQTNKKQKKAKLSPIYYSDGEHRLKVFSADLRENALEKDMGAGFSSSHPGALVNTPQEMSLPGNLIPRPKAPVGVYAFQPKCQPFSWCRV